jgi:hypothetical protein
VAVHPILCRLDGLAGQRQTLPGCVRAGDFEEVYYLTDTDNPHGPPTAVGLYDSLAQDHPLRSRLRASDCYDDHGRNLVSLGKGVPGPDGHKPLPWLPVSECVRLTLALSTPQKVSRQARQDEVAAAKQHRQDMYEASKYEHTRRLEAVVAE